MKKYIITIFILTIILGFTSCKDTFSDGGYAESELFKVEFGTSNNYTVNSEDCKINIPVNASNNVYWTLSNLPSWITSDVSWGKGAGSVTLNIIQNTSYEDARTTAIYFEANGGSQWSVSRTITITQNAGSRP